MSGAAALAAAKNRRGRSDTPSQNQVVSKQPQQNKSAIPSPPSRPPPQPQPQPNINVNNNEQQRSINPLHILSNHELRLNSFDKSFTELQNSINHLTTLVTTKKEPVVTCTQDNSFMNENSKLIERVSLLEEMFHHLKEDIFRVQTFAMETNLAFLKYHSSDNKLTEVNNSVILPEQQLVTDNIPSTSVEVDTNTLDVSVNNNVCDNTSCDNVANNTLSNTSSDTIENISLKINEPPEWTMMAIP